MPATCGACGQTSHTLASTSSAILVLNLLLLCGIGFVALASASVWLAALGLAVAVGINTFAWTRVELWPIDSHSVKVARRVGVLAALMVLLTRLFMQ